MKIQALSTLCLLVQVGAAAAQTVSAPIDRMEATTVRVIAKEQDAVGTGSGFVIGDGRYVVTNHHVIADAQGLGIFAKNLKRGVSRVVIDNPEKDLAVLELDSPTGGPSAVLGLNSGVQKTETVLAAGFPAAADDQGDDNLLTVKFSQGIISAYVTSANGEALYQISAPLNPGNSGGPLFDECGRVIGINVEKSLVQAVVVGDDGKPTTERVPLGEGIAWSIEADELADLLKQAGIAAQVESAGCVPGSAASGTGLGNSSASTLSGGSASTGGFWSSPFTFVLLGVLVFGLIAAAIVAVVIRSQTPATAMPAPLPAPYPAPALIDVPAAPFALPAPEQRRRLRGISGTFANRDFPLSSSPIAMGRSARLSQIVFKETDSVVSKRHCSIRVDPQGGGVLLEDCGSLNGTFLENGERLRSGEPRLLRAGSRFYLGNRNNLFEVE